ncbi:MAG: FAD-dependent oxidoreductase [Elusimicrobia bacterium]|nr:FAD-dependent oxidoreductase [Elusimicrobiota bacterium]
MSQEPTVVLGAGCAGLAAAWRLQSRGRRVVLIEAEDHAGGLAGGIRIRGNVYEYGPHIFHTTDPQILSDIKGLMGADLLPYRRTIQIKFLGNYFQFPLSMTEVVFKLPPATVLRAAASFVYCFVAGALRKPEVETSETLLRRCYGEVLYRIFFKNYITRVWGIPPSEFSPAFARERIPRFDLLEIWDKIKTLARQRLGGLAQGIRTSGYVEKVEGDLYTTRQGFSMITQRMAERFTEKKGELLLNTAVKKILREGGRVTGVVVESDGRERTLACEAVISTLPINEAALSLSPELGPEAVSAASALRFRAIVFVGIKVRRARVLRASFMYFREHSFNRITDLGYFGFKIEPAGSTLLVAEVSCDPKDRLWTDEEMVKRAVVADLVREDILAQEEIEEMHVFRAKHAQPMYTMGYEKALSTLLGVFSEFSNFETAGRQGRFQYVNTHVAMKMGYEAADRLLAKTFDRIERQDAPHA